jgi:peptide-methionine (R)-S-oxide reductase
MSRAHGTERPFTGPHLHENRAGTFACVCCGAPLFDTQAKFESGTGWPSFFKPFDPDQLLGLIRAHANGHKLGPA